MPNAIPILGPTVIGIMISMLLFGVFLTQTYVYYQNFPRDRTWLKYMVLLMLVMDFVNAFLLGCALFELSVTRFGDPSNLRELPRTFDIAFCLSIFIDLQSQGFYAYRLWMISGKNWMPCVCCVLSVAKAVSGFVSSYNLLIIGDVPTFMEHWTWPVNLTLACATANDLFTAVMLSGILWSKRGVGHRSTTKMLDYLVKWTVQTGILISVFTLTTNICFITMKYNFVWVGLHLMLPRIYSNSVLACLNGRAVLHSIDKANILTYATGSRIHGQGTTPEMGTSLAFHVDRRTLTFTETNVALEEAQYRSRSETSSSSNMYKVPDTAVTGYPPDLTLGRAL